MTAGQAWHSIGDDNKSTARLERAAELARERLSAQGDSAEAHDQLANVLLWLSTARAGRGVDPAVRFSRKIPDIGFYCCVGQNGQYD